MVLVSCGGKTADDGGSAPAATIPTASPTSVPPRPPLPEPGRAPITQASGGFSCGPKVCNAPAEDCCYTDALDTRCAPHGTCPTEVKTSCDSGSCTNGGKCCINYLRSDFVFDMTSYCAVSCAAPAEVACRGYDDPCAVGLCNNKVLNVFTCEIR
jgi:hypothetical protein